MKKCKYCRSEIDDKAKICPICKKRQPAKVGTVGKVLILIPCIFLLGFGIIMIIALNSDSTEGFTDSNRDYIAGLFADGKYIDAIKCCNKAIENEPSAEEAVKSFMAEQISAYQHITAVDLINAYEANEVNADQLYGGKPIVLTGTVGDIGIMRSLLGSEENSVLLYSNINLRAAQLSFLDDQEDAVAKLQKGDTVTVLGRCSGEGSNILVENIFVIDCIVLDN